MNSFKLIKIKDIIFITREKFSSRVVESYQLLYYINKCNIDIKSKYIKKINEFIKKVSMTDYDFMSEEILERNLSPIHDSFVFDIETLNISKREKIQYRELAHQVIIDYKNINEEWKEIKKGSYFNDVFFIYRNPLYALLSGIFQDLFNNGKLKFDKFIFNFIYTITKEEYKNILFTDKFFESYEFENNHFFQMASKLKDNENFEKFLLNSVYNHIKFHGISNNHKGTWLINFKNILYNNLNNQNFKLINLDTNQTVDYESIIFKYSNIRIENLQASFFNSKESTKLIRELFLEILKNKNNLETQYINTRISEFIEDEIKIYEKLILSDTNLYKIDNDESIY